MSDLYFESDLFSESDRSQRRIDELFGGFPFSIRSVRRGGFAPGMKPEQR
jgi:HSP20 family protein